TVHTHKPHFVALHCQEVGGKNYEESMAHVDSFVKELLSSDAMKDYNRARVYLDENYKSPEHFTVRFLFIVTNELPLDHQTCEKTIATRTERPFRGGLAGVFWIIVLLQNPSLLQLEVTNLPIYQSGKGYKAISKALGLPRTTVRAIIYKWRKHGTVEKLPRSDWPTKITPRAQRRLIQVVTKDPTTTSGELQASLASVKALGSCYFIHESLKNIHQFDFKAKKFKKVVGKEIYSDTLDSTSMLEKEKFPQDYFPEYHHTHPCCKWSRKGFIRTRWVLGDCAFDLVNIHLFHDASNLVAWENSPSVYSGTRQKALGYVLDRITDQRYEKLPYFLFGDFNFRLDSKQVIESLCSTATMQTVRTADTNEVDKLVFRESDNDRKVVLQLEKKLFNYINQDVFRENNGTLLLEFDKEKVVFKDRLHELEISFPPSYPYSEDSSQGKQYMNTRCPAWCDRILMSSSAKDLVVKPEPEEKSITYDNIGPSVCMGDHKPVFLSFRLTTGAGKPYANKHKCCVMQ
ncbi:hypothetical protein QTP70_019076, partial [Hemibagrus guttatus]